MLPTPLRRLLPALAALLLAAPSLAATVSVLPDTVWWESGRGLRRAHCDFRFRHDGPDTLELGHVEVSALDARGRLLSRRFIGWNGVAPPILTIANRIVSAGHPLIVFNPFAEWEESLPVATLRFRFTLESAARAETLVADVAPRAFEQRTDLVLPLEGRVIVFDAHDGFAHHRRFDLEFEPLRALHLARNSGRYAFDLSVVDESGSMWRTDGKTCEDWWSWGVPVRAPGAGRVVAARGDAKDWRMDNVGLGLGDILADHMAPAGNYVVIDHGHGEHSLVAHLREGTLAVKPGDVVRQGQLLGRVGFSGSVFTVHVHYELRTGAGLDVDGLPSRFSRVDRWVGDRRVPVRDGFLETGDIVQSR